MTAVNDVMHKVLQAYDLAVADVRPMQDGNINKTYAVRAQEERYVLQRLNPIFSPLVHHDIDAVTQHLKRASMITPQLRRTQSGVLWHTDTEGYTWRVLSFIPGDTYNIAPTPAVCREAGVLLARFHKALASYDAAFQSQRLAIHDTPKHMRHLQKALAAHHEHQAWAKASDLGQQIAAAFATHAPPNSVPARVVHGDPKLNNIVFTSEGRALCMIDLDTLARMAIADELGDAFRSWCNPAGENATEAHFDLEFFEAGMTGYAEGARGWLVAEEVAGIVAGIERIALELAARFCADVVEESYFGWNTEVFDAAWEHNLQRATSQYNLAHSIVEQRQAMQAIVHRAFNSSP